jgi:DNA repair and recombination protein RAD54B
MVVMIISYEMLLRSMAALKEKELVFDILVCDEAHRLKNGASKTCAAINSIPTRRRIALVHILMQFLLPFISLN